ncbi:hypothetical protein Scep_000456 [Stephania cephalantha]|uniref:VOC domain-containing protein n=1 Tax=Stephania cephalantha TaxID=152367 RepID=A0AAP0Q2Y9_9MAGN
MEIEEIMDSAPLPLLSLNHVSLLCRSVRASVMFYQDVLGFVLIKRPSSFHFDGAWLFNYGVGIHLLKNGTISTVDIVRELRPINPKDNHISFQCTDIGLVKLRLEEMGIEYVKGTVEEGGMIVEQVFFHDPDGYMIEVCNCDNIPVLPISSGAFFAMRNNDESTTENDSCCKNAMKVRREQCGVMERVMMERLSMDMLNISF